MHLLSPDHLSQKCYYRRAQRKGNRRCAVLSRSGRVDRRVGLSVLEQFINRDANVFGDLTEQDWGDISTLMKWNRCAATCCIAELFV